MTKRYDEPIEVVPDPVEAAAPIAFSWQGRRYEVEELIATWCEAGEWWNGKDARDREYHRVVAHRAAGALGEVDADGFLHAPSAVYDVYLDRLRRGWRLARVWD